MSDTNCSIPDFSLALQLKRSPLPAQSLLAFYATSFGNNGYVVFRTNSSTQILIGNRLILAARLRELARDLEPKTVSEVSR